MRRDPSQTPKPGPHCGGQQPQSLGTRGCLCPVTSGQQAKEAESVNELQPRSRPRLS